MEWNFNLGRFVLLTISGKSSQTKCPPRPFQKTALASAHSRPNESASLFGDGGILSQRRAARRVIDSGALK